MFLKIKHSFFGFSIGLLQHVKGRLSLVDIANIGVSFDRFLWKKQEFFMQMYGIKAA